jgi:hypothetical protein
VELHHNQLKSLEMTLAPQASESRKGTLQKLKERLALEQEINLSVRGRKSEQWISRPVWFVSEDDKLYLLPVQGSDSQWYKNFLKHSVVRISAGGAEGEFRATAVTDPKIVSSVVDKFREKYGTADVKKYYSKFDVIVVVDLE